jgi:ArsR family transcriptional regulator
MDEIVKILKALSDENRLRTVMMSQERPLCVCEINTVLNIALSTISAHLKILKNANIISDKKDGRWIIYQLNKNNTTSINIISNLTNSITKDKLIINDKNIID